MSGIVGIVHYDGAPVESRRLAAMTAFMSYRGPDAQRVWTSGPVGFGHAALRTTPEAAAWPQPLGLDAQLFIAGDVRLDGIAEVRHKLLSAGHDVPSNADDVLLVLYAYRAWGRECLKHLAGDFSFAIWDVRHQRLFCARDQIGVKPFFYSLRHETFTFSNTLECLRLSPTVSDELDDSAVADFLMHGWLQQPEDTFFRDIRRLPPAYWLEVSREGVTKEKYWAPPLQTREDHRRPDEYVEEFTQLLSQSVAERLRTENAAILMSGGLDSTSVAALALRLLPSGGQMHAYTVGYEALFNDVEPRWARRVADALRMPLHSVSGDHHLLFAAYESAGLLPSPEPYGDPLKGVTLDLLGRAAAQARVALTGEGGDVVVAPLTIGNGFGWCHLPGAMRLFVNHRELPRIGLRTALKQRLHQPPAPYPAWLNPDLERRLDLPARWRESLRPRPALHPTRPRAYERLTDSFWAFFFETLDPGFTARPVEIRHPWFSRRLIEFAFTIPVQVENFVDKGMIRAAMRGILPEEVRRRPKTALSDNPVSLKIRAGQWHPVAEQDSAPMLWNYLKPGTAATFGERPDSAPAGWERVPIVSLNLWLTLASPRRKPLQDKPQRWSWAATDEQKSRRRQI